ncbi:hypothetical protein MYE70_10370 [Marinobacter alexandrii]|uniref:hypothetical protein n=1 Tax=Marinobacter alexandrii TaxID=2570351 RepID=UPI001FFFD632|nr:hypothetical protein [Marinobacter alexandrii]MCK2149470.1 hypothetical protein [Marinobacter alexandrii]
MSEHELFERSFPPPPYVEWSDKLNDYTYTDFRALGNVCKYSGQWQAWQAARALGDAEPVRVCDGKEQYAFEDFAKSQNMDMHEHPLHYLFLNPETDAARKGWKAAIEYCRAATLSTNATPPQQEDLGDG